MYYAYRNILYWYFMSIVFYCQQASAYPTIIVYIMDIARSVNPVTFMSNMLFACRWLLIVLSLYVHVM